MATPALDFRTIDLNNLVVPPLQKKDHGMSCKPLYRAPGSNTPSELCIQTPICRFPFGLSDNTSQSSYVPGTPVRYNISASFDKYKENPLQGDFFKFATQIQDYAIHLAAHNSKAWFGEEMQPTEAKFLFNKWIKQPKGDNADKYDPTFRLSTRSKKDKQGNETGEFWTALYDVTGAPINLNKLENGSKGHMKIKLTSFYVIAGKFGWTWDVEWIRLTERSQIAADDYNANMYGEAPALPPPITQDGGASGLPPSASIYEEPDTQAAIKREPEESVASLEESSVNAPATNSAGKRIKRAN